MYMTTKTQIRNFYQLNLEGSSYEIGKYQGEYMKQHPDHLKFFTSGQFNLAKSSFNSPKDVLEFYNTYVPGIKEEFEGFAEGSGVRLEKIIPIDFPNGLVNNCSNIGIHPSISDDGHVILARTYDWNYDDEDMRLLSTKVNGGYRHVGFSLLLAGRGDGLNEAGLCVMMAGGGAWDYKLPKKPAMNFSFAIRSLLDRCNSTEQAVSKLLEMPVNTSTNYTIGDKSGKMVVVEGIDCEFEVRDLDDNNQIYSVNDYRSEGLSEYNKYVNDYLIAMNKYRWDKIGEFFNGDSKIKIDDLRTLLSSPKPYGLCTPHYSEFFGVLWTQIFDLTDLKMHACMGTPGYNPWEEYRVGPMEEKIIQAKFVDSPSGFNG